MLVVEISRQPNNASVATVQFGTDFGLDQTIYLTGLDQTNTNQLKKSQSVYELVINQLLTVQTMVNFHIRLNK